MLFRSISSWLERTWLEAQIKSTATPLLLLNALQEQTLWEQIIRQSAQGENLLHVTATAMLAKQAWQLCQEWQIDIKQTVFSQTEDSLAWQNWALSFQNHCQKQHWVSHAQLPDLINQQLLQKSFCPPRQIFLIGFDEITPQLQTLLTTLNQLGCPAQRIDENHYQARTQKIALPNTKTEIQTMALWCRKLLETPNSGLIGCIIPNLVDLRSQVLTEFTNLFAPETQLPGYPETTLPFNISAGISFKNYPVIQTALTTLTINDFVSLEKLSSLLLSPFLGSAEQEMTTRAELDAQLRSLGEREILLQQVITLAKLNRCPQFAEQLQRLQQNLKNRKESFLPSDWASFYSQQLTALGWPGERTLNQTEYQLAQRWLELLSEFASLDVVLGTINANTAYQHLSYLASSIVFQPQLPKPAPIQILGVLEAAGIGFQHLWVMGLHDGVWPSPANPNPFIPLVLQRQLELPHSSSSRELQFSQTLTQRLTRSAPEVIISFPQVHEDQILRPSPLLADMEEIKLATLQLPAFTAYNAIIFDTSKVEFFVDNQAPALIANEKIAGGTAIFKDQAACPFRAFARFRLGAQDLDSPQLGLSAIDRGSLLHNTLEILWNQIRDQASLIALPENQLNKIITQSINKALVAYSKKRPLTLKKKFTEIETLRLHKLLSAWLDYEKTRPPFTVLMTEQAQDYSVAQIPLKLRVDRIDQLPDGSHLIIDYKTSAILSNSWFDDRPDEPQLLIYCMANPAATRGLLLAQVRSGSLQFKGVSATDIGIKGVYPEKWDDITQHWQTAINKLGDEFQQGNAIVDPKRGQQTCNLCNLQLLCRIE